MSRHNSRILAFQALYSWDVSQASVEDLISFSWLQKEAEPSEAVDAEKTEGEEASAETTTDGYAEEEKVFAGMLIAGTIDHIAEIDKMINDHLSAKWTFERINKVTLAILRTSIYELKFITGAAQNIVIDEAVTIAKKYGADDSFKFINAVLDKIGKDEA